VEARVWKRACGSASGCINGRDRGFAVISLYMMHRIKWLIQTLLGPQWNVWFLAGGLIDSNYGGTA
jgi:hypothetical protein